MGNVIKMQILLLIIAPLSHIFAFNTRICDVHTPFEHVFFVALELTLNICAVKCLN